MNYIDDLQFYQSPIIQNCDMHFITGFRKNFQNGFLKNKTSELKKRASAFLDYAPSRDSK